MMPYVIGSEAFGVVNCLSTSRFINKYKTPATAKSTSANAWPCTQCANHRIFRDTHCNDASAFVPVWSPAKQRDDVSELNKMFTFVQLCWHLESPRSASTSGPESCRSWGVPLSWSRLPEGDCPGWRTCEQPSGMSLSSNLRRIILLLTQNKATWINKTQLKGKKPSLKCSKGESDSGVLIQRRVCRYPSGCSSLF